MRGRSAVSVAAMIGILVAGAGVGLELAPGGDALRRMLRDGFGPEGAADGRSARLLRQLGMEPSSGGWTPDASGAPSSRAVAENLLIPGRWLVSVAIPEESLRDPEQGLFAHPKARGRAWERVAWVSLFEGRRLVLATRAGLRLHGGSGRDVRREAFRLVLRPSYGTPALPPDVPLSMSGRTPDRFVVRRYQTMSQAQPLAFEIARRLGAPAPMAVPVRFVLNGVPRPETYELTEHVSPEGWGRTYFGHDDFRFAPLRGRASRADRDAYEALVQWATTAPAPLRLDDVAARVDIDRYMRHILTFMYCGTTDWAQGAAAFDLRAPRPRWFWVHWDLDQSFRGGRGDPWKRPSVGLLLAPGRPNERTDLRGVLFRRLLAEDPAFTRQFTRLVSETLNHLLTPDYLRGLVERGKQTSVEETPFNEFDLGTFFAKRSDEVFDAVAGAVGQSHPHVVEVRAPAGITIHVDGRVYSSYYRGRYFDGQALDIRAVGGDGKPRGVWSVNGRLTLEYRLAFTIDRDTFIRVEE